MSHVVLGQWALCSPWDELDVVLGLLTLDLSTLVELARAGREMLVDGFVDRAALAPSKIQGDREYPVLGVVLRMHWPALALAAARSVVFSRSGRLRWQRQLASE